jgi:hypothetical protein
MIQHDYSVFNMPALLNRSVKKQDPLDDSKWIVDESWYREVREMHFALFEFLQENYLVTRNLVETRDDVPQVVVKFSELTDAGKRFIKSGAHDRWLASFDRPGSKREFGNVTYLRDALHKLESGTKRIQ